MKIKHYYAAFNRTIVSDLILPEFIAINAPISKPDITIIVDQVSENGLAEPLQSGAFFQSNREAFWLHVPKVARFLVTHGQQIIIDPYSNVSEEASRVFLIDSCFKALLHQQQYLVLEGVAVEVAAHAVVFLMRTGYGKSTLAALFSKQGYSILTDEICAITRNMQIVPASSMVYLWGNIAKQLNVDIQLSKLVRPGIDKYLKPINFCNQALPIHHFYFVDYHKRNDIEFNTITPSKKFDALQNELCEPSYLKKISHSSTYLSDILNIPMVKIMCPRKHYTMKQMGYIFNEIFSEIEQDMLRKVQNHG